MTTKAAYLEQAERARREAHTLLVMCEAALNVPPNPLTPEAVYQLSDIADRIRLVKDLFEGE